MVTVVLALSVVVLLAAGTAVVAARRRLVIEQRRVAALTALADRIDEAVASLSESRPERVPHAPPEPPPAPLVAEGLPGRAALVDAAVEQVERAGADGTRLAAALVHATGDQGAEQLARDVGAVVDASPYAVGPRSVVLLLPGLGRAEALGTLARIEAQRGSSGRAVELEPGEEAVDLIVRLLSPAADAMDDAPASGVAGR